MTVKGSKGDPGNSGPKGERGRQGPQGPAIYFDSGEEIVSIKGEKVKPALAGLTLSEYILINKAYCVYYPSYIIRKGAPWMLIQRVLRMLTLILGVLDQHF